MLCIGRAYDWAGRLRVAEFNIRPAGEADIPLLARAIGQASGGYARIGWLRRQDEFPGVEPELIGAALFARREPPFDWRNAVVAELDAEPVAAMLMQASRCPCGCRSEQRPDAANLLSPVCMSVPGSWFIVGMAVLEPWRNHGFAGRLLAHAERTARRGDYPSLSLIAFERSPATRLYLRHGFGIVDRRSVIPHPLLEYSGDVLLMAKTLG